MADILKRLLSFRSTFHLYLRQSSLALMGQLGAAVFAYLFSVLAARRLGPVEFGVLGTAAVIVLTLNQITAPLALVVTNAVARFVASGHPGKLRHFVALVQRAMLVALAGLTVAGVLVASPLSAALRIPMLTAVLAVLWFGVGLEIILWRAVQQGFQAYAAFAFNLILEAAVRLLIGWLLLNAGLGANGAVAAYGAAALFSVLVAYAPLRARLNAAQPDADVDMHSALRFSAQAFVMTVCYALLTNADFLAVKRFLPEAQAGVYAVLQMFGKLAFTGFSALYTVMFSAVSHDHAQRHDTWPLFRLTLGLILVLGLVGIGLVQVFATPLIVWTVGADYLEATPVLTGYLVATVLLALLVTTNTFYLARRESAFIRWLVAGAGLLIVLLVVNHNSLEAVVFDLCLSYGAILVAYFFQAAASRFFSRT
jgi:O-antigen/teichoic acid export membrane protein